MNIPGDELRGRLGEVPRDRPVTAYCQVGMRGHLSVRILRQHGFDAVKFGGSDTTYRQYPDGARSPDGARP